GYVQAYGKDEPPGCYEDMDHADCFFLIGANMFECHPPLFERIQRRRRTHPETTLICIDPHRRTRRHPSGAGTRHRPLAPERDGPGNLRRRPVRRALCGPPRPFQ
ncbi:MAG: hypothetical protein EXS58_11410, partial [Candidatus Latescibacteria bacterium]|nr:hypothetical protein [Candidatus Latescibacterota bacterium]